MSVTERLAMGSERLEAELLEALERLTTEERHAVLRQLERATAAGRPVDGVSIVHESMKASANDPSMMVNYQELLSTKAPPAIKEYPDRERVALSRDFLPLPFTLDRVIQARASRRDYSRENLTLREISTLLHYSYGIRKYTSAYNTRDFPVRFVPSSGGLQAVEIYMVVNDVEGLRKGLYHYNAAGHALELLNEGNMRRKIVNCCSYQEWIHHANIVLILTSVMERVEWKYGVRGYRYIHIDTGFLGQNLSLVATALRLRSCPVAAYIDDAVNDLLEIDGRNEFVSLLLPIGQRPLAAEQLLVAPSLAGREQSAQADPPPTLELEQL